MPSTESSQSTLPFATCTVTGCRGCRHLVRAICTVTDRRIVRSRTESARSPLGARSPSLGARWCEPFVPSLTGELLGARSPYLGARFPPSFARRALPFARRAHCASVRLSCLVYLLVRSASLSHCYELYSFSKSQSLTCAAYPVANEKRRSAALAD